jgi:transposase
MKRPFLLDDYRSLIGQWFAECPSLRGTQIYKRLCERGVKIGYPTVVRFTREFRRKQVKIFQPLEFLPGEEGQVDWFFVNLPGLGKLCGFAMILSYSRYLFAHLFPKSSFEFFIEGHLKAFDSFGGFPQTLVYDNLSSVVLKRQPLQYNPRFLEFAHHYRFEIRLCNVAAGNEKGRVERVIRTLKETFFNAVSFSSLDGLNQSLHQWVKEKNETIHRATNKRPVDLLPEEKLKALPQIPWKNVTVHLPVLPTKTGFMIFDNNQYSIPDYLGKPLSIHSSPTFVEIYDGDRRVASHPRLFGKGEKKENPLHRSFRKISSEMKRERIFTVIKNVDPVIETFLNQNEGVGEDPYETAYQIFKLLPHTSRGLLISALSECLKRRSPRWKTLNSFLNREPELTPQTVSPQRSDLLEISYTRRPLEDYEP